jgi:hypothetical protein
MSHTPGPWEIDTAKDRDGRHHIIHGPVPNGVNPDFGYPICDTSNRHHCITPQEDAYNTHLLKAAPELLQACREQHRAIDLLMARLIALDKTFMPTASGAIWDATVKGHAAIEAATGHAKEVRRCADDAAHAVGS